MKNTKFIILLLFVSLFFIDNACAQGDGVIEMSTKNNTLLVSAKKGEAPLLLYYGSKLQTPQDRQFSMGKLRAPLYPAYGLVCQDEYAIQATHTDGNMSLDLVVESVEQSDEKNAGQLTTIRLKDRVYPFFVDLFFRTFPEQDIIETWSEIQHNEKKDVVLGKAASAAISLPTSRYWVSQFNGRWACETYLSESEMMRGVKLIANKEGIHNSGSDNPSVIVSIGAPVAEDHGDVFAGTLAYVGNYKILLNLDPSTRLNIIPGINEEFSAYHLPKGEKFKTPSFIFTYSSNGKGQISRNFHRWAIDQGGLYNGQKPKDILLNSWEGVYFNQNSADLNRMMQDFASVGGEMFVMDDGWFGVKYPRNDKSSSLGDWQVDLNKINGGIQALIDTAHTNGLKFGIWIEPEMINEKSELYEKHPEWINGQPNRKTINRPGRGQMTMDLTRKEVCDFIFNIVDTLLTKYPGIDYIKWDANHNITNQGSFNLPPDKQSHYYIAYHRGLEGVFARIRAKYPNVVMQSCASGGGRMCYGFLKYFDEFWVSDNTDALQRIYMQWGASHFFPAGAMASHVSAAPNHQTGRSIPLKFRFDVAMTGRLGMEMQIKSMNDKELLFSKKAIATYKDIRPLVQFGDMYRLVSPYENEGMASLMFVDRDKSQAVFFAYHPRVRAGEDLPAWRMSGLDPKALYQVAEINSIDAPRIAVAANIVSGDYLMSNGLRLPISGEWSSIVLKLERVEVK